MNHEERKPRQIHPMITPCRECKLIGRHKLDCGLGAIDMASARRAAEMKDED